MKIKGGFFEMSNSKVSIITIVMLVAVLILQVIVITDLSKINKLVNENASELSRINMHMETATWIGRNNNGYIELKMEPGKIGSEEK